MRRSWIAQDEQECTRGSNVSSVAKLRGLLDHLLRLLQEEQGEVMAVRSTQLQVVLGDQPWVTVEYEPEYNSAVRC